jgi:3-hydroxymyristoyl/3-hydroxydecanoyl-(acyl carrier protein) dehydratase
MPLKFIITKDHPSLAGHFPDNPVVPGVVILDQVISHWNRVYKKKITGFPQAKFIQILKPNIECFIDFQPIIKPQKTILQKTTLQETMLQKTVLNRTAFIITNSEDEVICKGVIEHE